MDAERRGKPPSRPLSAFRSPRDEDYYQVLACLHAMQAFERQAPSDRLCPSKRVAADGKPASLVQA
jgi:hypothetical protein